MHVYACRKASLVIRLHQLTLPTCIPEVTGTNSVRTLDILIGALRGFP
jgi:hypothetical protein